MAERRRRTNRFLSDGREFQFTTSPSTTLPSVLSRQLPRFDAVFRQGSAFDGSLRTRLPDCVEKVKDEDARTKRLAMWLWSAEEVYTVVNNALLSPDPQRALVSANVDSIAAALSVALSERTTSSERTFRGTNTDPRRLMNVERSFSMKTFIATSRNPEVAKDFGKFLMRFDGVCMRKISDFSVFPEEEEYLIPPDVKVRFIKCQDGVFCFGPE